MASQKSQALVRTPCVGVCSTTYGDLVCRGCKRFAHEIVQWNGFADSQKAAVWDRLLALRRDCALGLFDVADEALLRQVAAEFRIPDADRLDGLNLGYEVLRRLAARSLPVAAAGLASEIDASTLIARIDDEFYARSSAHYERNFKIALLDQ